MKLLLDTSTADCRLFLYEDAVSLLEDTWHADRELAEKLLGYLEKKMAEVGQSWQDISEIGVFRGPGSFTGLRIGVSVLNTLAHELQVPIVGASGDSWLQTALDRLSKGDDDKIVLPEYGRGANITQPKK